MKVKVKRSDLINAHKKTAQVVKPKHPKPILQNMKISAGVREGKPRLILHGNDQEIAIDSKIECELESEGKVLVNSARFGSMIGAIEGDEITIEKKDHLSITGKGSRFRLSYIANEEEYPDFGIKGGYTHRIPAPAIKTMLSRLLCSYTSEDRLKPVMSGALIELCDSEFRIVASDGNRLTITKCVLTEAEGNLSGKLTEAALKSILGACPNGGPCFATIEGSQAEFMFEDSVIRAVMVAGNFMNYRKHVAGFQFEHEVAVPSEKLKSAIKQALVTTADNYQSVAFSFENGNLTIKSSAAEIGDSVVEFPASYNGEGSSFTLHGERIGDFADSLRAGESVNFRFMGDIGKPDCMIPLCMSIGDGYEYYIQPTQI